MAHAPALAVVDDAFERADEAVGTGEVQRGQVDHGSPLAGEHRVVERCAQHPTSVSSEQAGKGELYLPMMVVAPRTSPITEGLAQQREPPGAITGPDVAGRVDEGLDHHDRVAPPVLEV